MVGAVGGGHTPPLPASPTAGPQRRLRTAAVRPLSAARSSGGKKPPHRGSWSRSLCDGHRDVTVSPHQQVSFIRRRRRWHLTTRTPPRSVLQRLRGRAGVSRRGGRRRQSRPASRTLLSPRPVTWKEGGRPALPSTVPHADGHSPRPSLPPVPVLGSALSGLRKHSDCRLSLLHL